MTPEHQKLSEELAALSSQLVAHIESESRLIATAIASAISGHLVDVPHSGLSASKAADYIADITEAAGISRALVSLVEGPLEKRIDGTTYRDPDKSLKAWMGRVDDFMATNGPVRVKVPIPAWATAVLIAGLQAWQLLQS